MASTGFNLLALNAGRKPETMPMQILVNKPMIIFLKLKKKTT
jgi:hypothetical protein